VIQFALQSVTISKVCRLQLLKAIRGHIFAGITVLVLGEMGREQLSVVKIRSGDSQSKTMQQKSRWLAA
jgi:hypothetical protein